MCAWLLSKCERCVLLLKKQNKAVTKGTYFDQTSSLKVFTQRKQICDQNNWTLGKNKELLKVNASFHTSTEFP